MRAIAALLLIPVGAANAQGAANTEVLVACSAKVDDSERLKCYDEAVQVMSAEARDIARRRQDEAGRIAAAQALAAERAREEAARKAEADKKAAFGAEVIEGAPRGDPNALKQVEAAVQETFRDRFDQMVFLLDNGQVWRQTEGSTLSPVKAGTPVLLKRGALGAYRMVIDTIGRTVQVSRVR